MKHKLHILFSIFLLAFSSSINANVKEKPLIDFVENKGQWKNNVLFEASIQNGKLFLEKDGITFLLYSAEDINRMHEMHHGHIKNPTDNDYIIDCHAYKMHFDNALPSVQTLGGNKKQDYVNYYIGNDKTKWASHVNKFGEITYKNVYEGIDFKIYSEGTDIKYDFIVNPGADPKTISYSFEGLDDLELKYNNLFLATSVNHMVDEAPYSYQISNKNIKTNYLLSDNTVSFEVDEYNTNEPLIIDPKLVFASFSGSTSDNWGFTATYDSKGHLYAGGIAFGGGFPSTTGAFQVNYNGGSTYTINGFTVQGTDISIMKYSEDGQSLIYSTYLGGSNSNESPHSLIVDKNDQLYVFGTTSSTDFPTTPGCYDSTFNGGVPIVIDYVNFKNGTDIFVSKFSEDGKNLDASTFVGGSDNDGLNLGQLKYNYADDFRGEIIIDNNGNSYVATTTYSSDFPVTSGAAQETLGGIQDGCIFKLNSNLSQLVWSTYIGGSAYDAAYGMQFNLNEEVYVAGGTNSSDFPFTSGTLNPALQGNTDGWIAKITNDGSQIVYCTSVGTSANDQAYFVQLDSVDNVYTVGQTEGVYPVQPATVYSNPNSGQFVHKFNPELSNTIFSTVIGTGSGGVDIALSAFLVNTCAQIYISGWGGAVNTGNGGPVTSTTIGLPVTADAIQSTTDGSDFYLMVLAQDGASLEYATFFGGPSSREHVDGGTSRFDKNGIVYQAVCGGCGGRSDFPVTAGAWSETNNSTNCNLTAFKLDLSSMTSSASIASPLLCAPANASFENNSNGGVQFLWDFGDGTTSTAFAPSHTYNDTGTYIVRLITYDPALCITSDTSEIEISVDLPPEIGVTNKVYGCYEQYAQLNAWGATDYLWSPAAGLDDNTIANPLVYVDGTKTYSVTGYNQCGSSIKQVTVTPIMDNTSISPDTVMCKGNYLPVEAFGGVAYNWEQNSFITNTSSAQAIVNPQQSSTFFVSITDNNGCKWIQNVYVKVDTALPTLSITPNSLICLGDGITLMATGGNYVEWGTNIDPSNKNDSSVYVAPEVTTSYNVTITNGCGNDNGTVKIDVSDGPELSVVPTVFGCPNDSVQLSATGPPTINWYPNNEVDNSSSYSPKTLADKDKYFIVYGSDNCGTIQDTVQLKVYIDETYSSKDTAVCRGQSVILSGYNGVNYNWNPKEIISNPFDQQITTTPQNTTTYHVSILDFHNCIWEKEIKVVVDTLLPIAKISNDTTICFGDTILLSSSGGFYYEWQSSQWISNKDSSSIYTLPLQSASYQVEVTNGCGKDDASVYIDVRKIESNVTPDTAACLGDSLQLHASGGTTYLWYPPLPLDNFSSPSPKLLIQYPQMFYVKIINDLLCEVIDSVYVDTLPKAYVDAGEETVVEFGKFETLYPIGEGSSFIWSPAEFTDCDTCFNPGVSPDQTQYFFITLTDEYGCKASDSVLVYVTGSLFVPNTFTPNQDGLNDIFFAYGEEIEDFTMYIFNRWGDMIYKSTSLYIGWNGTHKGKICPEGTYVWKVEYTETNGYSGSMVGHVNLLK